MNSVVALVLIGMASASNDLLSVFVPKSLPPRPIVREIRLSEYNKWLSYQHGPENPQSPFARSQVTSTSPSLLLMTSFVLPGASFTFHLNDAPLQSTTMPRASHDTAVYDPQEAFDWGEFSHATLVLDIGPHYLDVSVAKSPYENGLIALKLIHLQISPRFHGDYFMVETDVPVELANRTCQAFSSHLVHIPSTEELALVVKLFFPDKKEHTFYIGGYEEKPFDGSALVVVVARNGNIKVTNDIWNHKKAKTLCYRRYPPQQLVN